MIRSWRPDLLEEFGVGPIVAATVLCVWFHPGRVQTEAAFVAGRTGSLNCCHRDSVRASTSA